MKVEAKVSYLGTWELEGLSEDTLKAGLDFI